MRVSKRKKDNICGICGNIGYAEYVVTCLQCKKASEHIYCMQKQTNEIPDEWYCDECQLNAKPVHERPVQDVYTENIFLANSANMNRTKNIELINDAENQLIETKTPPHSPDITKEGRVPIKHAKVKFIPTEEVSFLTRAKLVGRRGNLSPSRHVTTPPEIRRASASMSKLPVSKSIQLTPLSPRSVIAEACISPKRATSVGHAGKNKEREMHKHKSSDGVLCSNIQSRGPDHHVTDVPVTLIINPKEKPPHPTSEACWMGTFEFFEVVPHIHSGIQAHFARQVSLKAYEISKQMPKSLKLEILPRLDAWPKVFQSDPPDYNDIGVYFFSHGLERPKDKYIRLLERISAHDVAMQTYIDTDIQLLIYSSKVLPAHSQFIDGQIYLWGIFQKLKRRNQRKPEQAPFCSPAKTTIDKCNQSITPIQVKSEEIDMDIDMVGGNEFGRVDMPIQRVDKPTLRLDTPPCFAYDGPPGFSRPISSGGNEEKRPLVGFLLKNAKTKKFREFPPGHFRTPVLKQGSNSDACLKGQNSSDNSPPSPASGGGYSGTAPKARERQPEQHQEQDNMHRSVGHSRTSSPRPSIKKKKGFSSEERLLGESKLHIPSMKLASLSAKESTKRFSEGPLFKSCSRNGEAALTRAPLPQKKQERDFKNTNPAGEGNSPKTNPMVRRVSLVSEHHDCSSSLESAGPKTRNLGPRNIMAGLKKQNVTEERGTESMGGWRKWDERSEKQPCVSHAYQSPFSRGKGALLPSPWPTWEDHAKQVSKEKQDLPSEPSWSRSHSSEAW